LPQGHFSLFTLFEFWAERYFKIPHFGSLFVLVHFVSFKRFTLRYFSNYIFYPILLILNFSPKSFENCKSVQILFLFLIVISFYRKQSSPNILQNCIFSPISKQSNISFLLFCKAVPQFHEIAKRSSDQIQVQMPRKCANPRGSLPLVYRPTWQPIKGQLLCTVSEMNSTRAKSQTISSFSLISVRDQTPKSRKKDQEHKP